MPGAKQRSVRHLCRRNWSVWHREQKRTSTFLGRHSLSTIVPRPFKITNGVNTVFTLFFSMMLQHVTEDLDDEDGVYIRFRIDGGLFNVSPHKDQRETDHEAPVRCPSHSALRTWRTSEEEWSSPSAPRTRRVPPTRHIHRTARTESSPPVQLLTMRYHIWLPK